MFPEAGGKFTGVTGEEIEFIIDTKVADREYGILGSSRHLHPKLPAVLH